MPLTPAQFDDRTGDKLRGERAPAPAGLWADIEAELPPERRRRGAWWWWTGGALAVAALLTAVAYLTAPPPGEHFAVAVSAPGVPSAPSVPSTPSIPSTPAPLLPIATRSPAPLPVAPRTSDAALAPGPGIVSRAAARVAGPGALADAVPEPRPRQRSLAQAPPSPPLALEALPQRPQPLVPLAALPLPYPTPLPEANPDSWTFALATAGGVGQRAASSGIAESDAFSDNNSGRFINMSTGGRSEMLASVADAGRGASWTAGASFSARHRSGFTVSAGAYVLPASLTYLAPDVREAVFDVVLRQTTFRRFSAELDLGYARRLGRWTASAYAGAGGLSPKRVALPWGDVRLRSSVFAKAGLGLGYALTSRLGLEARGTYTTIGSRATLGLRYGF